MISAINSKYDRAAELKAFDETKAGVKGLVDSGITTIPKFFIHSNDSSLSSTPSKTHASIPIIDLSDSRKIIVSRIREASETWGFFQVVNHGIPVLVLEEMLKGAKRFYEQDDEVKKEYYTRDSSKKMVYNSNYDLYTGPAANWRDTFYCFMAPQPPKPEDLPSTCREILVEYSKQVMGLGKLLMELLSEALGLNPCHLNDMGCSEGLAVLCHYYPACPQPELTLGTSKHADDGFLTVLLQDQIGGLQILHDNQWFDVPPAPGALVINIADLLQLITNDRFKSVEHRVLANKDGPRISVACFFSTGFQLSSKIYGPIKELLSEANPPLYKEVSVREYVAYSQNKGLNGISGLLNFKL
ncbi:1-aminocyclopropane-1-carboxylate oxidase homolog 1-like [Silene latifolia]|uniref:1-aminocyclopropane-1-carboxylate oxidase homolog 1-like n=1 Tax=Silene latifolia TaxID=37657 RepID=UPI003D78634B